MTRFGLYHTMLCCKAVVLANIVCIAIGARIHLANTRNVKEQPSVDQLSRTASLASHSEFEDRSLDKLLAPDDGLVPAAARPPAPVTNII